MAGKCSHRMRILIQGDTHKESRYSGGVQRLWRKKEQMYSVRHREGSHKMLKTGSQGRIGIPHQNEHSTVQKAEPLK